MRGQLSIFDILPSDDPCDDCIFDTLGGCDHIVSKDFYCVEGSFRIRHEQIICPKCGKKMTVRQCETGGDFATCRCGLNKIFGNKGNRKSNLQAWRDGELIGT